jgi:hypothetical protein
MADPWRKLNNTAPFGVDTTLLPTDGSIFPLSCCHPYCRQRSNDVSVKALLAARGDFLLLARVGGWLFACVALVSCKKNELVDEAKASGLTTADFLQSTAGESDHGKQRQAKV